MTTAGFSHVVPDRVAVVGAGMVGLATALPEPAVLKYGVRAVLSPSSPVYVPPTASPRLLSFLTRFARNSTAGRWKTAMDALVPINRQALPAFDFLAKAGVEAQTYEAKSFLAAYRTVEERKVLLEEIDQIGAAIRLHGQRFINPGEYVNVLADSVRARGGQIISGVDVKDIVDEIRGVRLVTADGETDPFDAVVMATGAWLTDLARQFGVRTVVQAGRGYSFSVPIAHVPAGAPVFPGPPVPRP